jgi:hypothetical protein
MVFVGVLGLRPKSFNIVILRASFCFAGRRISVGKGPSALYLKHSAQKDVTGNL